MAPPNQTTARKGAPIIQSVGAERKPRIMHPLVWVEGKAQLMDLGDDFDPNHELYIPEDMLRPGDDEYDSVDDDGAIILSRDSNGPLSRALYGARGDIIANKTTAAKDAPIIQSVGAERKPRIMHPLVWVEGKAQLMDLGDDFDPNHELYIPEDVLRPGDDDYDSVDDDSAIILSRDSNGPLSRALYGARGDIIDNATQDPTSSTTRTTSRQTSKNIRGEFRAMEGIETFNMNPNPHCPTTPKVSFRDFFGPQDNRPPPAQSPTRNPVNSPASSSYSSEGGRASSPTPVRPPTRPQPGRTTSARPPATRLPVRSAPAGPPPTRPPSARPATRPPTRAPPPARPPVRPPTIRPPPPPPPSHPPTGPLTILPRIPPRRPTHQPLIARPPPNSTLIPTSPSHAAIVHRIAAQPLENGSVKTLFHVASTAEVGKWVLVEQVHPPLAQPDLVGRGEAGMLHHDGVGAYSNYTFTTTPVFDSTSASASTLDQKGVSINGALGTSTSSSSSHPFARPDLPPPHPLYTGAAYDLYTNPPLPALNVTVPGPYDTRLAPSDPRMREGYRLGETWGVVRDLEGFVERVSGDWKRE